MFSEALAAVSNNIHGIFPRLRRRYFEFILSHDEQHQLEQNTSLSTFN